MIVSGKEIRKSITVNAGPKQLWKLWTSREGLNSFFGKDCFFELQIGGAFEIYFLMDNDYGQRGSEGCKILSYLPDRMLSFSWNAPPQFPEIRNSEYKTWVVIEFLEHRTSTELRLTHTGWPESPEWDPVFEYFNNAWIMVLDNLKAALL